MDHPNPPKPSRKPVIIDDPAYRNPPATLPNPPVRYPGRMTPREQLEQKPREVQLVLLTLVAARTLPQYPVHPTQAEYDRYTSTVLTAWEEKRAQHPDMSEIDLARSFNAFMTQTPNSNWSRLIAELGTNLP